MGHPGDLPHIQKAVRIGLLASMHKQNLAGP